MVTSLSLQSITSQTSQIFTYGCSTIKTLVVRQASGTHSGCTGRWGLQLRWSHVSHACLPTVEAELVILGRVVQIINVNVSEDILEKIAQKVST